jgi:hypothetical protein
MQTSAAILHRPKRVYNEEKLSCYHDKQGFEKAGHLAGLAAASRIFRPLVAHEDTHGIWYAASNDSSSYPGETCCPGAATSANAMKAQ